MKLEKMPILLFFWIFCKYQLDKFGWLYYSNFLCPYWFSILLITESIIFKSPNIIVLISFFSSSFIFSLENNYFTILWWFLLYIDMNQPWVYMCPPILNTPLPPPSPYHPSGLSQSTHFGYPASCIELTLVIYFTYGNIHVSLIFSQIIPPLPSPAESKSLFFTCVSPLLPCM